MRLTKWNQSHGNKVEKWSNFRFHQNFRVSKDLGTANSTKFQIPSTQNFGDFICNGEKISNSSPFRNLLEESFEAVIRDKANNEKMKMFGFDHQG
jgi:septin family protein